jgi:hypothetical protein
MLLVATPPLADPNFDRTVVYMLEHTDSGGDDNEKSANDFDGLRPREVSLLATHDAIFQL